MMREYGVSFLAKTDRFDGGIKKMSRELGGLRNEMKRMSGMSLKFGSVAASMAPVLLQVGALALGIGLIAKKWPQITAGAKAMGAATTKAVQATSVAVTKGADSVSRFRSLVAGSGPIRTTRSTLGSGAAEVSRLGAQVSASRLGAQARAGLGATTAEVSKLSSVVAASQIGQRFSLWGGKARDFGKSAKRAASDVTPAIKAVETLKTKVNSFSIGTATKAAASSVTTSVAPVIKQIDGMIGVRAAMDRTSKKIGIGMAGMGLGILAVFAGASKAAISLEKEMRNLNVIMQVSDDKLAKVQKNILSMSTKKGSTSSATDLAKGSYDIASSGFSNPAANAKILGDAQSAAAAGLTDTKTAAKALVTVLNAYNMTANESSKVSDILFQTVNVGQVTFEELATNISDFVGVGKAAGATAEELFGAYAQITLSTGNAAKSGTALHGILRGLTQPTEALSALYKEWGFTTGKQAVQTLGLQGVLDKMDEATKGSATETKKLIQDSEGMNGVFALNAKSAKERNDALMAFKDPAKLMGTTAKAMEEQSKSTAASLTRLKNIAFALAVNVGSMVTPAIKVFADVLSGLGKLLNGIPSPIRKIMGAMAGTIGITLLLGGSYLVLATKIRTVTSAMQLMSRARSFAAWTTSLSVLGPRIQMVTAKMTALAASHTMLGRTTAALRAMNVTALTLAASLALVAAGIYAGSKLGDKMVENKYGKVDQKDMQNFFASTDTGADQSAESMNKFTQSLNELNTGAQKTSMGDNIRGMADKVAKLHGVTTKFYNDDKSKKNSLKDIDTALSGVVDSGNTEAAVASFNKLASIMGMSPTQMLDLLPKYGTAMETVEISTKANTEAARQQQMQLDTLANPIDEITKKYQEYADKIKELTGIAKSWLSLEKAMSGGEDLFQSRKAAADEAEREADAQKTIRDAQKDVLESQEDLAEARKDAAKDGKDAAKDVAKAQKERDKWARLPRAPEGSKRAEKQSETEDALSDALDRQADVGKNLKDAQDKVKESQDKVNEAKENANKASKTYQESLDKERFSLSDFSQALGNQLREYGDFNKDIEKLSARGLGMTEIGAIKSMGEGGRKLAKALVSAPNDEFDKVKGQLQTKTENELSETVRKIEEQLVIAKAVAKTGAAATVDEILNEMARIAPGINTLAPGVQEAIKNMLNVKLDEIFAQQWKDAPRDGPGGTILGSDAPMGRKLFDDGGILRPGKTMAVNKTGQNEYVFTAPQLQKVVAIMKASGNNQQIVPVSQRQETHFHGDIKGDSFSEIKREGEKVKRRTNLTGSRI